MATMKAVRIHSFGDASVLVLEKLPVGQPGEGEILLKVEAAGVNPVDYKIRAGKYPAVKQDQLPIVLGRDVAGTVDSVGAGTDGVKPGDSIYAMLGQDRGGYTEYVIVKTAEAAHMPAKLNFVSAGAVPLAALTAWQGLFDHGGLREGQRVLIHGGSGGVGHFAIQFAKARGARVYTTVSADSRGFVRELGADEAIDYKTQRFEDVARDIDLVYDLVAGETQQRSWSVLKRGGTLVSTLTEPSQEQAAARGVRAMRYTAQPSGAQLKEIARLIDAGKVRVIVDRTFPLSEAAEAQRYIESAHVRGKVVLTTAHAA